MRPFRRGRSEFRALAWLLFFAMLGGLLVILYPDADQQDSAYHYLFARWAGRHPAYFVSVWARPLFTTLYFLPAQLGHAATKLFTLAICLAAGWQTVRVAEALGLARAEMAVPLLFLQPSFFLLSTANYTETLFALVFVIGLRLHFAGRVRAGMLVGSLLILARPEGLFLGILWGLWAMRARGWRRGLLEGPMLASGMLLWWLAALAITGDPQWIRRDWPPDWQVDGKANGTGPLWWYLAQLPLIVGPLLLAPFLLGLRRALRRREGLECASAFGLLLIAHALMYWRGWFGSAGYARYLVCVSPAIALVTLTGWNRCLARLPGRVRPASGATALALSLLACLLYLDGWKPTRDARAIEAMHAWFLRNERPVAHLINSQAYARVLFDRDVWEKPAFTNRREENLALLRRAPAQTLVLWDDDTGPKFYRIGPADFEAAGFRTLHSREFRLHGRLFPLPWDRNQFGGTRVQRMTLLYK
ncbi:MAG: hypothetical protein SF339_15535 [Blastocatellia bacterium]|nr:hypothetical protein [Blastocatellia bacterium]